MATRKPRPVLPKVKPTLSAVRPVSPGRTPKTPKDFSGVKIAPRAGRVRPTK